METKQRKAFSIDWTEQDTRDAQRLLRVLVERAEKIKTLAGGGLGPAQIQDPSRNCPCVPKEKGGNPEHMRRSAVLDGFPQSTLPREAGSDPVGLQGCEKTNGLGMGGGRADFTVGVDYVFEKIRPKDTARPALDASLTRVDRTFRHAPEDGE